MSRTRTSALTSFDPNADIGILSMLLSGTTLYVGGSFLTINGGTPRNRLAAVDLSTSTATAFDANANAGVNSIVKSGNTLYVGGSFTAIGTRGAYIAPVDATTGSWLPGEGAGSGAATKFVITRPQNVLAGTPGTVTVQTQDALGYKVTTYDSDVTLVVSGSATGGGVVDIVNGEGSLTINDNVAELVNLSLTDSQGTGLDVSSTETILFSE